MKWSVPFGEFDEFCFGTLGLQKWLYCTKDAAIGEVYVIMARPVKKSWVSEVEYEETFAYESGYSATIRITTSALSDASEYLYYEPYTLFGYVPNIYGETTHEDGGMGVWVRSSTKNSPTAVNMSGSFRHGVVAFNRSLSEHIDGGARTFNLTTNGGCTVLAMVMFTGTPQSGERVAIGKRWAQSMLL